MSRGYGAVVGRIFSDLADSFRAQASTWQHRIDQGTKEIHRLFEAERAMKMRYKQNLDQLESITATKTSLNTLNPNLKKQLAQLKQSVVQVRGVQDKSITQKDSMAKMYGNYLVKMKNKASLIEYASGTNDLAKAVVEIALLGLRSPECGAVAKHASDIARALSKIDKSIMEAEDEDDPFALGEISLSDKLAELRKTLKSTGSF
ncbi:hypothetical protein BDV41DRAFT_574075 [Aspergillus transmontanensis]|uniref:Uncharacterized protein n=1 Tax=Aspergillus transmontanensis TaxID=1034304 RepID=A0A5N6W9G0_9EURO|nr:hypothetical protein BDV41DRAFT_574075 [Aspergillus transmontanensis]